MISRVASAVLLGAAAVLPAPCAGHASYHVNRCTAAKVGDRVMGQGILSASAEELGISITTKDGAAAASYAPGEELSISVSAGSPSQFVLHSPAGEITLAADDSVGKQGCANKVAAWPHIKSESRSATWTAPDFCAGDITFTVSFAPRYGQVKIRSTSLALAADAVCPTTTTTTTMTTAAPDGDDGALVNGGVVGSGTALGSGKAALMSSVLCLCGALLHAAQRH